MTKRSKEPSQLCFCGYVYDGRKCKEIQKKYPTLKKELGWHKPVGEYIR